MENEKVLRLRELKERLLNTALRLKDRLNDEQENGHHSSINFNRFVPFSRISCTSLELNKTKLVKSVRVWVKEVDPTCNYISR